MSNAIVKFEPEQLALIKRSLAKDLTDEEFLLYMEFCKGMGLNPLIKQIYAMVYNKDDKYKRQVVRITSIDGYRSIAESSNKYLGQTKQEWCDKDGNWYDVWIKPGYPFAARVGVHKAKAPEPTYAVAYWESYFPKSDKKNELWKKFPEGQISKCAEALALRKAFPQVLGSLYIHEEMEQATNEPEYTAKIELPDTNELPPKKELPPEIKPPAKNKIPRPYTPEQLKNAMFKEVMKINTEEAEYPLSDSQITEMKYITGSLLSQSEDEIDTFTDLVFESISVFITQAQYQIMKKWLKVEMNPEGEITGYDEMAIKEFNLIVGKQ
jgi:phage recombination protein Bet